MCCNPNIPADQDFLLGIVLCGGKSSRMGVDKGLIKTGNKTWVEVAFERFESLQINACVSINNTQRTEYLKLFTEEYLILDLHEERGPLGGLMSVHNKYPEYDLLLVACDLPNLSAGALNTLINAYKDKVGEHDFFVYTHHGETEPLAGIYTAEGLSKIYSLLKANKLEKNSMKHILEIGNTYSLEIGENNLSEFKNFNETKDL